MNVRFAADHKLCKAVISEKAFISSLFRLSNRQSAKHLVSANLYSSR